jgi:hypothetical protein
MAMDKEEQALLLLTNRLLFDWISLMVDQGRVDRNLVDRLIDFSAQEVVKGAPWVETEVQSFADLFKQRLPRQGGPDQL